MVEVSPTWMDITLVTAPLTTKIQRAFNVVLPSIPRISPDTNQLEMLDLLLALIVIISIVTLLCLSPFLAPVKLWHMVDTISSALG